METFADEWVSQVEFHTVQRRYKNKRFMDAKRWKVIKNFLKIESAERFKDREEMNAMPEVFEFRIVTYRLNPKGQVR